MAEDVASYCGFLLQNRFFRGPLNFQMHLSRFLLPGRVWLEYFVICKVRVSANFLRFNLCVWRASKLLLLVLGRFNYYCIRI